MKIYVYAFEKLEVWQLSKKLVKQIYRKTKGFPPEEKFGLTLQLRRAAVSVASNLAEGSVRRSMKDRAHFTNLSYSSLMEVLNQLILACELEFLREGDYLELRQLVQSLSYKLNKYRDSQMRES